MNRNTKERKLVQKLTKEIAGMKLKRIPEPRFVVKKPHSILELSCYSVRPSSLKRRKALWLSCAPNVFISTSKQKRKKEE